MASRQIWSPASASILGRHPEKRAQPCLLANQPGPPAGSSLSLSESGGGPDDGSESAGESDPDSGSPADSDVPNLKFTARWPPTGPVH